MKRLVVRTFFPAPDGSAISTLFTTWRAV